MSAHGDEPEKVSDSSDASDLSDVFTEPSSVASQNNSEPCLPAVPESVCGTEKKGMEATRNVLKHTKRQRSFSSDQIQTPDSADDDTPPAIDQAGALPTAVQSRRKSTSLQAKQRRHSLSSMPPDPNRVLPAMPSNKVISTTVPVQNFIANSEDPTISSVVGPSRRRRSSSFSESPYTKVRPDSARGRRRISSSRDALEDGMVPPFEETSLQASHDVVATAVVLVFPMKEEELVCGRDLCRDSEYKSHIVVGEKRRKA